MLTCRNYNSVLDKATLRSSGLSKAAQYLSGDQATSRAQ